MAITSPEAFLEALGKSQLLTPEQFAHAQDTLLLADSVEQFAEILINEGFLTEWQASCLIAGQIEFIIGKYILLGLLGRGGMGSVFLARHVDMKHQAALKIISRRVGRDPASRERFMSEARAAASLDHPNIVRAFDIDKDRERFFIVMEFVDGHDLEELVEVEGPLDFEFIVDCIRQAAKGLAHAHGRGMIHCDIKPSNLLVTESGTLKILDMGMARLINQSAEDSSSDSNGRILGTVDYMSPEQAVEGPDFDHRADIYSLGCTMYYMLTGHPPFDEGTLAQRIVQHQTQAPPNILDEQPDTPRDLVQICMKMMAKDPADRFQSAEELVEVLDRWRPPEPEPLSDPSAADAPKSTGVAIDEDDYSTPQPLESVSSKKSILSDERRLVFWMAIAAVIVGGILAIVAVLLVLNSGSDEEGATAMPSSPYVEEPVKEEDSTKKSTPSPAERPNEPTAEPTQQKPPTIKKSPPPKNQHVTKKRPKQKQHQQQSTKPRANGNTAPQIGAGGATSVNTASSTSNSRPGSGSKGTPPKPLKRPVRPKVIDPFKELPRAVQLPPVTNANQPMVLGKLYLADGKQPKVQLLGGELAIKGNSYFDILDKPEASQWLVRLFDSNNEDTDVARLWLRGGDVMFAWLDTAEGTDAAHLRNCLLKINIGKDSRFVRLVKPKDESPLTLKITKGKANKRFSANKLSPKNSAMCLVVTAVGGLPDHKDPKKTAIVHLKDPVVLHPGDSEKIFLLRQGDCRIELRTKYTLHGSVGSLDVTAFYRLATRTQTLKFSVSRMQLLDAQIIANERKKNGYQAALDNNPDLSETRKKARQKEIKQLQSEIDWLTRLREWYQSTGGVLRVQFQECVAVGAQNIVILDARLSKEEPAKQKQQSKTQPSKIAPPIQLPLGRSQSFR